MATVLEIQNLCKNYPGFSLDNLSFSMEQGQILGFLGRNGAGKTTTLKSILGLVHPDSGNIHIFGKDFSENPRGLLPKIGYAAGGVDFYPQKTISGIVRQVRPFYPEWNEETYRNLLKLFRLDEAKKIHALSQGMKVKFQLALALSHGAELFLLDEPTSGLDPVSRAELVEIFQSLASQGAAILFSTHITSDLTACATDIAYIQEGRLLARKALPDFLADYPECSGLDEIMVLLETGKEKSLK